MAYSDAQKRATIKYVAEKQKQIMVKYKKEEFEENILPAIKESGLPVATFFKEAVKEKIARDQKKKEKRK